MSNHAVDAFIGAEPEPHVTDPENVGVTVVCGGNGTYGKWGRGADVAEAKKNFRKVGGLLKFGYTVFEFDPSTEFTGVDQMGYVHWRTVDGTKADEHRPTITEHPAR